MATLDVKTQPLDRADLARFFPEFRVLKAFENMVEDVSATIPEAIDEQSEAINEAKSAADAAQAAANVAQAAANTAAAAAALALSSAGALTTRSVPLALVDGPSIAVNASANWSFYVTLGGNRSLAAPTGLVDGAVLHFAIRQDTTGSRTLSFASIYDFGAIGVPVLSKTGDAVDYLVGYYDGGSGKILCIFRAEEDNSIARVSASNGGTVQSIPTSTWTKLTLGSEDYDVGGYFTSSQWTPPEGRAVQLCGSVAMNATAGSSLAVSVYKNGVEFKRGVTVVSGAATKAAVMVSCQDIPNGTDYYELWAWQNTGAAQNTAGAAAETWFQATTL